jgi:hypothetical protein
MRPLKACPALAEQLLFLKAKQADGYKTWEAMVERFRENMAFSNAVPHGPSPGNVSKWVRQGQFPEEVIPILQSIVHGDIRSKAKGQSPLAFEQLTLMTMSEHRAQMVRVFESLVNEGHSVGIRVSSVSLGSTLVYLDDFVRNGMIAKLAYMRLKTILPRYLLLLVQEGLIRQSYFDDFARNFHRVRSLLALDGGDPDRLQVVTHFPRFPYIHATLIEADGNPSALWGERWEGDNDGYISFESSWIRRISVGDQSEHLMPKFAGFLSDEVKACDSCSQPPDEDPAHWRHRILKAPPPYGFGQKD